MGAYGLGRGVQSFYEGIDDADNKRYNDEMREQDKTDRTRRIRRQDQSDRYVQEDRETAGLDRTRRIENEDTDRANKAEDRTFSNDFKKYGFDRDKKLDTRTDEQNKIADKQKTFVRVLDMAQAEFNVTGDPTQLQELYNKRSPYGGTIQIDTNEDGTYNLLHTSAEGEVNKETGLSKDAIRAMAFSMRNPDDYMKAKAKEQAAKAKQANEMAVLQQKHRNNVKLERVKNEGKGGKIPGYVKEFRSMAKNFFNGEIDAGDSMAEFSSMAEIIYNSMPQGKQSVPFAANEVKKIFAKAAKDAGEDGDPLKLAIKRFKEKYGNQSTRPSATTKPQIDTGTDGEPPVPGAEKADDGFWYLKKNNKWFKVEK